MAVNTLGDCFRVTTFGESHGPAVGVVIDGIRGGVVVDLAAIQRELNRRRPGQSAIATPRKEADQMEVLSGIIEDDTDGSPVTTGGPICLLVRNLDAKSGHYEAVKTLFRPGHGDFTWWKKFGVHDWRGGGRLSGRETVARVAAGALARQLIAAEGITITGHVLAIGDVHAQTFDPATIGQNPVRCADPAAAEAMVAAIREAQAEGDSLGGIVEVVANGVPAGLGDPLFQKLDAQLAHALVSIGAVKGVEFGDGFALAARRGSRSNDPLTPQGFASNRAGGILGGISTGEPIVARVAVKPTSAIRQEQDTVDREGNAQKLTVPSRHDPCIAPRLVPVAEAMIAITLCDALLRQRALREDPLNDTELRREVAHTDAELLRLLTRRHALQNARGDASPDPADRQALLDQAAEWDLSPEVIARFWRLLDA